MNHWFYRGTNIKETTRITRLFPARLFVEVKKLVTKMSMGK